MITGKFSKFPLYICRWSSAGLIARLGKVSLIGIIVLELPGVAFGQGPKVTVLPYVLQKSSVTIVAMWEPPNHNWDPGPGLDELLGPGLGSVIASSAATGLTGAAMATLPSVGNALSHASAQAKVLALQQQIQNQKQVLQTQSDEADFELNQADENVEIAQQVQEEVEISNATQEAVETAEETVEAAEAADESAEAAAEGLGILVDILETLLDSVAVL